ncbi:MULTISPECIES: hypothetical protein [Acinetobacter]|uniref:Lipoprotein n=1 Tax=Acinetobacter variabilis TaxID=70346 RepID=A0A7T7WLT8_9GAMM|nr:MULTISPECIES: hypothetical protein [Acinetobacter]QKQ71887.1 hypothetical protein E5Y90_16960 [Acinetobacter sp. 10FS3-1]QQN89865.1 hypothetical protein IAQ69_16770 [Acinetobacter variabilis]WKT71767.1 hypothetical protein Q3F87_00045 [Acinetobacter variabilis]
MKKLILSFITAVALGGCDQSSDSNKKITSSNQNTQVKENTWQLLSSKDEMRGTETKWLSLRSENSAGLDFPYDGINYLTLDILNANTDDTKIFLTIDRGQYDCGKYGCYGSIKFGNTTVQDITFHPHDYAGSDGTMLVFRGNTQAFKQNIGKFNEIIIELPFYKNGSKQFKFKTNGFNENVKKL